MAGLSLDVLMNATQAQREAKNLSKALDGVSDTIDDLGRDGAKDLDKLSDKLQAVARDGKKADSALDNVGTTGKKGFAKAGEATSEFKQEALSNLSEVTSSFDGSMTSIQDLVQGTLGGLAGSIPGIGLLAAGAAVGVGLIGSAFEGNTAKTEANKQAQADWADAFIQSNGRVLSSAVTTAKAMELVTDPEQFTKAQTNAKNWGVDVGTAVAAMAGEAWALAAAQQGVEQQTAAAEEALARQERQVDSNAGAAYDLADSAKAGASALSELTGNIEAGSQQADAYSQYLRRMAENTEGATKTVDEFGDAVYNLPDGSTVYVDAETGRATSDIDAIERKLYSTNGKTATVDVVANDKVTAVLDGLARTRRTVNVDVNFRGQGGTTWY